MTTPGDRSPSGDDAPLEPPVSPGAMRVGDVERTSALDALATHLTDGRLTLDEYGERSAQVTVARTVDDLAELFDDLPQPHPTLPTPGSARLATTAPAMGVPAAQPTSGTSAELQRADQRSRAQKIVAAAASASVFVALALFFLTGTWLWFLLIPAISGIAQAVWGPDWKELGGDNRRQLGRGRAS